MVSSGLTRSVVRMTIPLVGDVRPFMEDFELRLRDVLEGAWGDWLALPPECHSKFDKTTRANCIFDFAKHRALATFGSDSAVRAIPNGRSVKFLFRDRVLVRLKKANPRGLGSNIPTQAVLEFISPQLPLMDLPEIYNVEILYTEDVLAKSIRSIDAVFRMGYQRIWSWELARAASASVVPISPRPDAPLDGSSIQPATARPKGVDKGDKQNDGE
jgi:hypothetical protein